MNKYFKAISSNYILFIISTVFFLVITGVAVRVMGEEFYGLWIILNSILLFSSVGVLGMGTVVNKFASEVGEDAFPPNAILTAGFAILLPMACLVALVILILRDWIAVQMVTDAALQLQMKQALLFTTLSIFPQFLGRVPYGYLLSQLKNTYAVGIDLGINVLLWSGVVVITMVSRNLVWMAAWGLLVQMIGALVLWRIVSPMVKLKWTFDRGVLRQMLGFSRFSFLLSLANMLIQYFDRILVGFVLGPAAAGVYSVGTSVALRLTLIAGQATDVMLPYSSKKSSEQDNATVYHTFRQLNQFIGILIGLLAGMLILWMDWILTIWISPDYAMRYAGIFRILILAYIFTSTSRSGYITLMGVGKIRTVALVYITTSLSLLVALYILAGRFGLNGAAVANLTMVLTISINIMVYQQLKKGGQIWSIAWDLLVALVFPAIAWGMVFLIPNSDLLIRILVSCVALVMALIILNRLSPVKRYIQMVWGKALNILGLIRAKDRSKS